MNYDDVIIRLENVNKSYGDHTVLNDINLNIRRGEFVTFLGPSGCGKTTTLRIIAGFLKPDSGSLYMEGKDISEIPPYRRPLNTVFQRYALFPHLDVYDNIAFGLKLAKVPTEEINTRVKKILKMVSMTDYEDRNVNSLSGGQQQRVAIARALVNQPKVLLLDEPLAALDLKMRRDMQIELKEMHKHLGITFIYVTHDQEEALTLSDTIVVMNKGKILQTGTPQDIYNEPVNSFVADFIGESNILNATMIDDRRVSFIGHDFDCVDEGFGHNVPVDVVVRPEDIYIVNNTENAQFTGVIKSSTFKGVHNEIYAETDTGNELMIQDYNTFEVGSKVGFYIKPQDIQVMRKERTCNTFLGEMLSSNCVKIFGEKFNCEETDFMEGDKVIIEVDFDKVELLDDIESCTVTGMVDFILYKGDHYHLTIVTDVDKTNVYVDTTDVWDKNDLVGISIPSNAMRIRNIEN